MIEMSGDGGETPEEDYLGEEFDEYAQTGVYDETDSADDDLQEMVELPEDAEEAAAEAPKEE